jgi:methylmalonyl-CoA mutase N-terminal domain/subunit
MTLESSTEHSKLSTLKRAWQDETLSPLVRRFPERKERFTTSSESIEVQPLYTPESGRAMPVKRSFRAI